MRGLARFISAVVLLALGAAPASAADPVTIFAAASMDDALEEVARVYRAKTNVVVRISFAASSTLARQIEQGAPATIFISADETWMDYLDARGLIERATRRHPVGNRLVLIAPATSGAAPVDITASLDLAALLGKTGRLSIGDPAHVPAGTYAKQALEKLGLWTAVAKRIAPAENVRVALAFVERGEAPLGIVYATDARASKQVKVLAEFPPDSHSAIRYPFAIVTGKASPETAAFFAFLTGDEGLASFTRFGFARD